jgi:hypothetical protein
MSAGPDTPGPRFFADECRTLRPNCIYQVCSRALAN